MHFEFHLSLSLCSGIDLPFLFITVFPKLRITHDGTWAAVYSMLLDFFSLSLFYFYQFLTQYRHSLVLSQFLAVSLWGRLSANLWRMRLGFFFFFFFSPFTMGGTLLNDMISFVCLRNGLDKASMRSQRQLNCTCESDWEAISLSN